MDKESVIFQYKFSHIKNDIRVFYNIDTLKLYTCFAFNFIQIVLKRSCVKLQAYFNRSNKYCKKPIIGWMLKTLS